MDSDLSSKPSGFEGTINGYQGDEFIQLRLVELGFVRGEKIKILRFTPFGDPIVTTRGATVALRREEANCLIVS